MPKTTTINSVTSNVSVTNVPSKTEASCKQYEQEFVQLSQEINQLQDSLRLKFQELADLKENIIDHKKIKSQINSQARKLNNLRLNLPNFLIIGVQKGGTTWIHENLKRHPQIFLP
ncbi:MAG: hypothetical protein WBM44_16050, partial [Waterburya sp.]